MVGVLDSGASGPGSSPSRGQCLTVPLSTQVYKWVPASCWGNLTNCGEVTCNGLASRPGEVEILLAASCYRNRDKHRQLWASLGSKASFFFYNTDTSVHVDFKSFFQYARSVTGPQTGDGLWWIATTRHRLSIRDMSITNVCGVVSFRARNILTLLPPVYLRCLRIVTTFQEPSPLLATSYGSGVLDMYGRP